MSFCLKRYKIKHRRTTDGEAFIKRTIVSIRFLDRRLSFTDAMMDKSLRLSIYGHFGGKNMLNLITLNRLLEACGVGHYRCRHTPEGTCTRDEEGHTGSHKCDKYGETY